MLNKEEQVKIQEVVEAFEERLELFPPYTSSGGGGGQVIEAEIELERYFNLHDKVLVVLVVKNISDFMLAILNAVYIRDGGQFSFSVLPTISYNFKNQSIEVEEMK